ncbi:hypothetical protein HPB47_010458, partial [Ixodes persulcatus]
VGETSASPDPVVDARGSYLSHNSVAAVADTGSARGTLFGTRDESRRHVAPGVVRPADRIGGRKAVVVAWILRQRVPDGGQGTSRPDMRTMAAITLRRGVASAAVVVAGGPSRPVGRAGKSADWHDGNWRPRRRRTDWSTESSRESAVGVEQ